MKKQAIRIFTILNLFIALAAGSAQAHTIGAVTADIPFAFTVGDKTLPAGRYIIQLPSLASGNTSRLVIRDAEGRSARMLITNRVYAKGTGRQGKLVFTKYGDQHFLWRVFSPDYEVGQELPESKGAERLSRAQVARQTVTLVGR